VDNLFDRSYAGSVIVNEGNARYFEPASGRQFTVKLSVSRAL
jgi:iron complex outermembrane recepter protein